MNTWTLEVSAIAAPRLVLTDRAGRWSTRQVGEYGRSVSDVADELDCDWHTVNDAVQAYGAALLEDSERIGVVNALGLDETLFVRRGEWHRQYWATSIVDVRRGVLLDMIEGRDGAPQSPSTRPAPADAERVAVRHQLDQDARIRGERVAVVSTQQVLDLLGPRPPSEVAVALWLDAVRALRPTPLRVRTARRNDARPRT